MHKLYVFVLFLFAISLAAIVAQASAISVTDPPVATEYAPVFISGFQMTDQLDVIEIYNESSDPVDLSTWSVQYPSLITGQICKIKLQDWIPSTSYVLAVARSGASNTIADTNKNVRVYDSCQRSLATDFSFSLVNEGVAQETVAPTPGAFVRKGLTKTYRTSKFSTDFIIINRSLYAGQWYDPPESPQLQFSEILINSRNCSPLETAIDCGDYVKMFNPTDKPIDLSMYRLRNGYLGQSPSSCNTTTIEGVVESGHFIVIPITVTNSASWLWLEDSYGIKSYDNTVQDYPDGSSDTKKGQAWAYDSTDDNWKWTTQPTPSDLPSVFPSQASEPVATVSTEYASCDVGQYRSEETNRCRSVVSAVASLIPCEVGQERNLETNRCRSTATVLGTTDLVPCKAGQERNPETNHCRNVKSAVPQAEYKPEQSSENSNNFVLWLSLGAVGLIAVGYAIWEWRQEIIRIWQKLVSFLKPSK